MKWFTSAIGFVVLAVLAGWVFLAPSDNGEAERGESVVDSGPVESSAQPEKQATNAVPSQGDRRAAAAANASPDAPLIAAVTPEERLPEEDRTLARSMDKRGTGTSLDELRKRIQAADALPAERHFLAGGQMDVGTTLEALGSDAFSKVIDELAREAYGDFDAQALSDVYGSYVDGLLEDGGGFALDRLVCGMRVCMGEAFALNDGASWPHLGLRSSRYGGPPMFASAYDSFVTPDGLTVYQFFFTTDPESRGIVVHRP